MQNKTIRIPCEEAVGTHERFCFNGFSFPVMSSLNYHADGPDKKYPDRLFIEDKAGRFILYFEEGYDSLTGKQPLPPDYDMVEVIHHDKHLTLCYPLQRINRNMTMSYFRIEFSGREEKGLSCCGDLSISTPEPYLDGLRKYTDLYTLFTELAACKARED